MKASTPPHAPSTGSASRDEREHLVARQDTASMTQPERAVPATVPPPATTTSSMSRGDRNITASMPTRQTSQLSGVATTTSRLASTPADLLRDASHAHDATTPSRSAQQNTSPRVDRVRAEVFENVDNEGSRQVSLSPEPDEETNEQEVPGAANSNDLEYIDDPRTRDGATTAVDEDTFGVRGREDEEKWGDRVGRSPTRS